MTTTSQELRMTEVLAAPLQQVYAAWVEPERLCRWFATGRATDVSVDLRPGGRYRVVMHTPDGTQMVVGGEYREIVPNELLRFSWQWEGSPAVTEVELRLRALDDDRTELTLVHSEFPDAATRDLHDGGWRSCLASLPSYLALQQGMAMKLHYFPLSTYSQKVLIALYEKGLVFEPALVNLASSEARAEFENKVYPIGKVPYLKATPTMGLPESTAIIEYLDEAHPGSQRLVPLDREAARQVRFSDRMCDLYVNEPTAELLFQKIGWREVNEEKAARARKHLGAAFANMEQRLAQQDWLTGSAFTMADCAAIPPLFYAQFVFPFTDKPAMSRYWQRAQLRPSYAKVMAEFVPLWEAKMAATR